MNNTEESRKQIKRICHEVVAQGRANYNTLSIAMRKIYTVVQDGDNWGDNDEEDDTEDGEEDDGEEDDESEDEETESLFDAVIGLLPDEDD